MLAELADRPEAANNFLRALRPMLALAVDVELIVASPMDGIKKLRGRGGDGIHTWTGDEIAQFEARHPIGTKARLALALALYTAQRPGDVRRMGRQHLTGDGIKVRQEKTGASLIVPVHPELARALAAAPQDNMTFLVSDNGAPFSDGGFRGWFKKQCIAAGLPHCSAHGLRKAAATRLADAGCTAHEIAAITGHKSLSEVQRYTKAADQARLARSANEKQMRAEREQDLSNLGTRLDKSASK